MTTNPTSPKAPQGNQGFSLIEMLLYVAILVFMLAIILEVVLSIASSDRIIKALRNLEGSAALTLERVTREARQADSVNTGTSVLGAHPGRLVLDGEDVNGNPRTVEFYLSNGRVMLTENGVETGALTDSDATVTNLIFRRFASSTVEGIRTELTVNSGTSTNFRSETFYSSVLLR